jgi:hypothetical protein
MANNVKFKAPALPIPPTQYNQSLFQRTFSVLRLYFNQLDEHLRQDLGDTTINGDLTVTGGVTATTLTGTLQTAAQTNITSVGALDGGSITSNFGNIAIGTSTINSGVVTITSTSTDADLIITTSESGATESPIVDLVRSSGSPADDDELGMLRFYGYNDRGFSSGGPEKTLYGSIYAEIADASDGSEDGRFIVETIQAGSTAQPVVIDNTGVNVTGPLIATNDYHQFRSTNTNENTMPLIEVFRDKAVTGVGSDPLGGFVFTGRNEDDRKVSYGSFYCSSSDQSDDGEQKASLVFSVADGSGAVDPFTDYTNDSFNTGHAIALNINADYFITTGYLRSDVGELKLGPRQAIKESALQGDAGQSTYDLHMPESNRAKVMQIGGIGPLDAWITANQSVAQMIQYRGQNMIIVSSGALEFELPACAASSDISATTCNIGDIFQISNAAGGSLTIDRDGSGTAQTVYYFPSLTLTSFTNNPTLAVGGTMMLQAVAANIWMIFNDSGLSDA